MENKKLETKRILLFLAVTFTLTYIYEFFVVLPLVKSGSMYATVFISLAMFFPSIGVLMTRLITKEGFKNSYLRLNLRGNIKTYLFAWFLPMVLIILGAILYYLIFGDRFDINMTDTLNSTKQSYIDLGQVNPYTDEQMRQVMLLSILASVFSPVLNATVCFGEEWGWRGYLLPKMQNKLSAFPLLLLSGVIWGLWHLPLIIAGHNYGFDYFGYPVFGIIAMCVFCIVIGVVLSFFTVKTKSVWPAVLAHGAINGCANISSLFHKGDINYFVGPLPIGIIGGFPFVVTAAVMLFLWVKKEN